MELTDHIQDFINSCLPNLRSPWPEVRGSAAVVIGKNFSPLHLFEDASQLKNREIIENCLQKLQMKDYPS